MLLLTTWVTDKMTGSSIVRLTKTVGESAEKALKGWTGSPLFRCLNSNIYTKFTTTSNDLHVSIFLFINIFQLILKRAREKEKYPCEIQNIDYLPPACSLLGIKPITQTWALTWNWTSNLLVHTQPFEPQQSGQSFLLLFCFVLIFKSRVTNHKI